MFHSKAKTLPADFLFAGADAEEEEAEEIGVVPTGKSVEFEEGTGSASRAPVFESMANPIAGGSYWNEVYTFLTVFVSISHLPN